jgi:hypothetical protein
VLVQGSIWGWVWIVGGGWVLAEKLDYIEVNFFQLFLPAVLLLVGGSLVYRTFARPKPVALGRRGPCELCACFRRDERQRAARHRVDLSAAAILPPSWAA